MFCNQCGKQVNDNDKFCFNCGYKLGEEKNLKQDVLKEVENDFSNLDGNIEKLTTNINSEKEYFRKKWITILLFLIPYTSIFGIHHFYNKRYLRGILYISLDFLMLILAENNILYKNFIISFFMIGSFLYFFITDLTWSIKLPKIYFVKNKYNKKIIILASLVPIVLSVAFYSNLSKKLTSTDEQEIESNAYVTSRPKAEDLIKKMSLEEEEEEKFIKAIEELGIYIKQITQIKYAPELEGMYTYSKDENTKGVEDGYRVSLSNGKNISVYVQDGKFLSIYYLNDFIYENGKVAKSFKQVEDEIEESKFKSIKVGETIKTSNKEITINSLDFKNEVHPPNKSGYYTYYKSDPGEVYLHISTTIKNLEKQAIYCDEAMEIVADYNDGYKYYASSVVEDTTTGFTYSNIRVIEPLNKQNIHYLINLPEEIKTNTEAPLSLTFIVDNEEYRLKIR